ncbi:MAG: Bax protein [Paraglaciecola sp.]|jgi:Bax protein
MKQYFKMPNSIVLVGVFATIIVIYLLLSGDIGSTSALPSVVAKPQTKLAKLPDFSQYADVKEKKEAFFNTLYPIIEYENQHIAKVRQSVLILQAIKTEALSTAENKWLTKLAQHYKVTAAPRDEDFFERLLLRVDYLPPSLALTQAAIESGWGSSRFSKQGNNLFGQWCFKKGCGMVPSARDSGKGHEVARFKSVNDSVRAYLQNLNTHSSYQSLRQMRARIRQNNGAITGVELAKSLLKYSEEGPHYVKKVTRFINQNKLQRFTAQFEKSLFLVE